MFSSLAAWGSPGDAPPEIVLFQLYIIPSVGLQARKVRFRFCRGELRSPASPEKTGAFS